jgi:NADH-quinone oxidoreductase subunit A
LLANYGYIGLFLLVAIFFAVTTLLLPLFLSLPARLVTYFRRLRQYLQLNHPVLFRLFSSLPFPVRFPQIVPYNPNPVKSSTFECGMETIGKAWVQFNFRYYFYALMFIALDVLVVFLYPWAVDLRKLGFFGFIGVLIFISIIVVGYIYAWRRKVLEWK